MLGAMETDHPQIRMGMRLVQPYPNVKRNELGIIKTSSALHKERIGTSAKLPRGTIQTKRADQPLSTQGLERPCFDNFTDW
jgi:hypothetical protein